jgi:formate hydrogenlyase subunit 3/multisubunit Na+/H+ antiporter MnhD subunit
MPATTSDDIRISKPFYLLRSSLGTVSLLSTLPVLAGGFLVSINLWLIGKLGHFVTENPVSLLFITSSSLLGLFMLIYAFAVMRYEKSRSYADRREYERQVDEYIEAVHRYEEQIATIRQLAIKRPQT